MIKTIGFILLSTASWNAFSVPVDSEVLHRQRIMHEQDKIPTIAAPIIKKIPIQESHEELIDLNALPDNATNRRIKMMPDIDRSILGYHRALHKYPSYVRKGLLLALQDMVLALPENIGIWVYEAYRPLDVQKKYFKNVKNRIQGKNPKLSKEEVYRLTSIEISSIENNVPVHCTGAAIDMTLIDLKSNLPLPMGKFSVLKGHNEVAKTYSKGLTKQELKNRKLLLAAASKAGLVNYPNEWWHFSIGDRYAAYFLGKQYAIYGIKVLP